MPKTTELLRNMSAEYAREVIPGLTPHFRAGRLTTPDKILEARQLATTRFVEFGKIPEAKLNADGVLKDDTFLDRSVFFGAYEDDSIVATTRLVWSPDSTIDDLRLPASSLEPDVADFLSQLKPGSMAEIGSLAKISGTTNLATLKLLREVFAFADEQSIQYLVCGLEPKILPTYQQLFGGAIQRLHEEDIEFPGIIGKQTPLIINLYKSFSHQKDEMHKRSLGQRAMGFGVRHYFKRQVPALR